MTIGELIKMLMEYPMDSEAVVEVGRPEDEFVEVYPVDDVVDGKVVVDL